MRKLGNLKWQGEKPSWLNIETLNRPNSYDNNDIKYLSNEVERLKFEKADIAVINILLL